MSAVCLLLLFLCSTSLTGPAGAGKVLMMGPSGSHWLNLVYLAEGLVSKGHDVVSLVPSNLYDNQLKVLNTPTRRKIHLERFEVPLEGDFFDSMIDLQVQLSLGDNENQSVLDFTWTFAYEAFKITTSSPIGVEECEVLVFDEKLISKLQQMNFDILIIDPAMTCGNIVARLLNIPLVIMQAPHIMPGFLEYATQAPVPIATFYSFRTDFTQRLKNLFWHCFAGALMSAYTSRFGPIASRALGYKTTILELMAEADLFLMRGEFIMHPPHPAMPNMVYIGGYHVQNINPLPKDLERFLEESGDAGVVVLSFGSYAKVMGRRKAEMLAAGLAKVPFKVIWKFQGQRPKNTGKNTLILDWIPQNDLLAHPKTRLFITHCGINAVYEAMFHGVPMVRVPAFAEQHGNSNNLETLGTGVTLDIFTMTSDDLYEAIMEVANNKTYKSNAVRLAQLQQDQPQSPMDRAVWWIEHVIRHGGLPHLKSAARHLSLLQYHLLDVVALLCMAVVAAGLFLWLCCRCCCRVLCGKKTAAKQKQQ
ncbi:PREDICTED: LOW QUALITY PROTEIN: UDP-glucuronosyltransferase 1-1-like [Branchiostoma belcheri]|uniref:UDP-glucuronosyltransferase n=1 Tax=Branchiostoma belcheri TaxID=7741 RepID=A0A6P4ZJ48_BRABE|nr:PREDICTED: LOW QUALITY PROTEIN: UDP-glucuronosyltransferase 1-1-like [Branchiostoma belcheri]